MGKGDKKTKKGKIKKGSYGNSRMKSANKKHHKPAEPATAAADSE